MQPISAHFHLVNRLKQHRLFMNGIAYAMKFPKKIKPKLILGFEVKIMLIKII